MLLACAADDTLLRRPLTPLSELFPDLAPQPLPPGKRVRAACDGTGIATNWEGDWSRSPYSEPPYGWRDRMERLEEAVFGEPSY